MLSHGQNQSHKRKSQQNIQQKNKDSDFWEFINAVKQSITHDVSMLKDCSDRDNFRSEPKKVKLKDHRSQHWRSDENSSVPSSDSDDDEESSYIEKAITKLNQATEAFLRNIKAPDLMQKAIEELDKAFKKDEWERILFQKVIASLSKRTDNEDTNRVLRVAYDLQKRKLFHVLLLFHLVDLFMKGYPEEENITASSFMDLLVDRKFAHIQWMITASSVLVSCKNDQFNSDEIKEIIAAIVEGYIDQWIYRLEVLDESDTTKIEKRKKKRAFYNRVLPKPKLDELKRVLLPVQEAVQDSTNTVSQATFKYRKRKDRYQRTIKFVQRKSAFEVHEVVIRLHYTKHLLRNYVSSKMEIDELAFIEEARSCIYKFNFTIEKSSWNRSALNEYLEKKNMNKVRFREELVDVDGKDEVIFSTRHASNIDRHASDIDIRLDSSDPRNLWMEFKFPRQFRFTTAHIETTIDAEDDSLLRDLFGLTTKHVYQTSEVDNYESYSRSELWNYETKRVDHNIVKQNAFYTPEEQDNYFDRDLVSYPITSVVGTNKLPIGIEFRGRRMKTNNLHGSYGTIL
ncbi:hypothetical protein C9374_007090 [Naegleria lovaniensis]|uniref:Uncharacterized protein n=1 Tax=Naegleria lovaniensis TaxID=51637 RepID=A0AA88H4S6_NAELO|nr:uncharacterized protein C9374_007090 [Naegleria lovaniensis]KAG2393559.1 hypothetical protein C9374_007090 [Naegleria lovaniensis]